jgi:hypothetical protein
VWLHACTCVCVLGVGTTEITKSLPYPRDLVCPQCGCPCLVPPLYLPTPPLWNLLPYSSAPAGQSGHQAQDPPGVVPGCLLLQLASWASSPAQPPDQNDSPVGNQRVSRPQRALEDGRSQNSVRNQRCHSETSGHQCSLQDKSHSWGTRPGVEPISR